MAGFPQLTLVDLRNDNSVLSLCSKITWDDVLKIETNVFDGKKGGEPAFTLHYIHKLGKVKGDGKGIRWKHVKKDFTAEEAGVAEKLGSHMSKLFDQKGEGLLSHKFRFVLFSTCLTNDVLRTGQRKGNVQLGNKN